MTYTDIALSRLINQQIAGSTFKTAANLVSWMGAMQAQDYAMAKWAIGIRLSGVTEQEVQTALDKGKIIRTHLLRPTWHLVAAADIWWILELTAPHIKTIMNSSNKKLELKESIIKKSNGIIVKALRDGNHLTRDELALLFKQAKIATDENRLSHIMFAAEMEGIVCNGAHKNSKQTYALLAERVKKTKTLSREEALAKLAEKYFHSHAPATLKDFIWWSGLPVRDAKRALDAIKQGLTGEPIGNEIYWLPDTFKTVKTKFTSAFLLPAYDEFIISYKNRAASLTAENNKQAISNNGIFKPVIIINGQASGLWKRSLKGNEAIIEATLFRPHTKPEKKLIEMAADNYGVFVDKKAVVKFS